MLHLRIIGDCTCLGALFWAIKFFQASPLFARKPEELKLGTLKANPVVLVQQLWVMSELHKFIVAVFIHKEPTVWLYGARPPLSTSSKIRVTNSEPTLYDILIGS